jgi:hypothetical protein
VIPVAPAGSRPVRQVAQTRHYWMVQRGDRMTLMGEEPARPLSPDEQRVLAVLLDNDLPGAAELRDQVPGKRSRGITRKLLVKWENGVGLGGFEPPTSTSRTWRANQAALQPVRTQAISRERLPLLDRLGHDLRHSSPVHLGHP